MECELTSDSSLRTTSSQPKRTLSSSPATGNGHHQPAVLRNSGIQTARHKSKSGSQVVGRWTRRVCRMSGEREAKSVV